MKNVPGFEDVEKAVIELRGKKIILDSEVAKLYGVTTREINQAVKNNPEKFPYLFLKLICPVSVLGSFRTDCFGHNAARGLYAARLC